MGLVGKTLVKYNDVYPQKHLTIQKYRKDNIGYMHTERMDKLFVLRFVLALKDKYNLYEHIRNYYSAIKTPTEIVDILINTSRKGVKESFLNCSIAQEPKDGDYISVDWVDLGFNEVDVKGQEDFEVGIYVPELKKEVLWHTLRVFKEIESNTLTLDL